MASAGGGASVNAEFRLSDSVGLAAIGVSTNPDVRETAGFWLGLSPGPTAIAEEGASRILPAVTSLHANHPNPFHPRTRFTFDIAGELGRKVSVKLEIFDVSGRLIKALVTDQLAPGSYESIWDGRDANLHPAASGVYFGRLSAGNITQVRRLVLIR